MKTTLILLISLLITHVHANEAPRSTLTEYSTQGEKQDKFINIELQDAKLNEVLKMVLTSVMKREYIFSSDIETLATPVNISLKNKTKQQVIDIYYHLLKEHKIQQSEVGGVLYLSPAKNLEFEKPLMTMPAYEPQPLEPQFTQFQLADEPQKDSNVYYYQPNSVQPSELIKILALFGVESSVSGDGYIVYAADSDTQEKITDIFLTLDIPSQQFEIIAATYEVTKQDDSQRSIDIIGEIFKNVGISILTSGANNIIRFTGGSLSAAIKFFDSDTRFRSISKPYATVRSGESMRFQSGQDVPILGNITTNNNVTQQSIVYRQSGVILDVEVKAVQDNIDLKINHELSNFVQTRVGVNQSPTLNKQSLNTAVSVHDKEILVIGGLSTKAGTISHTTLAGLVPTERISTSKDTETYVFLQVNKL